MARKTQLDTFDVRERFAADPLKCIRNLAAKRVLREQDPGWRPWVRLPLAHRRAGTEIVAPARWEEKYWNSLSGYLEELIGDAKLGARFADLLVGYLLVVENEYEHMGPTVSSFREAMADVSKQKSSGRAMRPLRRIMGSPATSRPQRRESLKLVLSRNMVADLVASGLSRKFACEERLPQVWAAIGVKLNPKSILRTERRSRKRTT